MPHTLFIINPSAGGGSGLRRWTEMRQVLFRQFEFCSEVYTESHGDGIRKGEEAVNQGYTTVVAVGGDGTLNEVINGVAGEDGFIQKGLRIGYIGLGSSNDLLRTIGIAGDDQSLQREICCDLCRLAYASIDGTPRSRYFILNSSIGVVSKAVALFNRPTRTRRALRRLNADLAVLSAGLSAIMTPPRYRCTLQVDDGEPAEMDVSNLAVAKSPHVGGGMNYGCPSTMDDGRLCLLGFEPMTAPEMIRLLPKMYDGTIVHSPKVWTKFAQHITISAPGAPPIEADGELLGEAPVTYDIYPQALTILV